MPVTIEMPFLENMSFLFLSQGDPCSLVELLAWHKKCNAENCCYKLPSLRIMDAIFF